MSARPERAQGSARNERRRLNEIFLTLPSLVWLGVFFFVPTLIVFAIAFRPADPYGGIGDGWTLETIRRMVSPNYPAIIWRTFLLSVAATFICLTLAVPVGYCLARVGRRWRQWILLLVVIPFWTNFLVRVFAWKSLLATNGSFRLALVWLGVLGEDQPILFTPVAILLVLVYTYLPFAILPVYASAEKFDFSLLEAARDLGASSGKAFFRVFLPGISRGLATAAIMVLVPSLGSYVIPDLVGGASSEMLGNKIAQYVYTERNLPRASALSAILTVVVVALLILFLWWSLRRDRSGSGVKKGGLFT
ncbi:MAG: ABC transporter permease [Planctomycetota bacterium]|jgi:spermidine/putrescine transport system permease protein|nr:ABC transporter permease [Planctomycetota bacterium]